MEYQSLIKKIKKEPMNLSQDSTTLVNLDREEIQKIIPHRYPFVMIDCLTKVNLKEQSLEVKRDIDPTDPIFEGHFPDNPVYPGVLQLEMMGQAGLCLAHFLSQNSVDISQESQLIKGVFTKVHHAIFLTPVLPGDSLTIIVKMIEYDELLGTVCSQILKNKTICSLSVLEVYFDD